MLRRMPEPERMTPAEENDYALADYSGPHVALVRRLGTLAKEANLPPGRLVDLGTGPGDIPLRVASTTLGWAITALDLSPNMLGLAAAAQRARGLGRVPIRWVQADLKATGLPAGTFDALISNSVLHHMPSDDDVRCFWAEVKRLAAPARSSSCAIWFALGTRPAWSGSSTNCEVCRGWPSRTIARPCTRPLRSRRSSSSSARPASLSRFAPWARGTSKWPAG